MVARARTWRHTIEAVHVGEHQVENDGVEGFARVIPEKLGGDGDTLAGAFGEIGREQGCGPGGEADSVRLRL